MADIDLSAVADELAALTETSAAIEARIKQLRAQLLTAAAPGATVTGRNGQPLWQVRPGRRTWDDTLAAQVLPPDVAAACQVAKVDGQAVKRLSPALWEACCREGAPYVAPARR